MLQFVGVGEVRHQGDVAHLRYGAQPRMGLGKRRRHEAEPIHPRVHFQVNIDGSCQASLFQQRNLFKCMDGAVDAVLRQHVRVSRVKNTLKQQYRFCPSHLTQTYGAVRLDQSKAVGSGKTAHAALEPVAIGIGLDHCPHQRAGRAGPRARQVVLHGIEVDGSG